MKRGQISFEYLILMGFVTLVLGIILGIALYYSGSIQDNIRTNQLNNFANKIISSSEGVAASGTPSKITIKAYLPEGISNLTIIENSIYTEYSTSTGINKRSYPSDVNITGTISTTPGLKKIQITAQVGFVTVMPA